MASRTPQDRRPARKTTRPTVDTDDDRGGRPPRGDGVMVVGEARPRKRKEIRFRFDCDGPDGEIYTATPPKAAAVMMQSIDAARDPSNPLGEAGMVEDWILEAFGEDIGNDILDRLRDVDDVLDMQDVHDMVKDVTVAAAAGDPTG